ncbi:truncated transposase [Streptococcus dysgalactiae subsp. equisimilis GGS_124]|nr:truncated transposase [Streptococcus dysgalactiae subsp. equisimilis GGS_124]
MTLQFVPIVPCYLYVRPVRTTKKLSHGIFGKTIWNSARTFVIKGGMKELYQHRKETIERLFGTAKEYHNLLYTREKGKSKMEDKVGLTLACLNLKKLVKRMAGEPFYFVQMRWFKHGNSHFDLKTLKKTNTKSMFVFNLNSLLQ